VIAKKIAKVLGPVDRDELLKCLRDYKAGGWKDAFEEATRILRLN